VFSVKKSGAVAEDERDTEVLEEIMTGELHGEIAGEGVGAHATLRPRAKGGGCGTGLDRRPQCADGTFGGTAMT
jgi:hypothetical protein